MAIIEIVGLFLLGSLIVSVLVGCAIRNCGGEDDRQF